MTSTPKKDTFDLIWKPIVAYAIWFVIRNAFTKLSVLKPAWDATNDLLAYVYIFLSAKTLALLGFVFQFNARNIIMGNHAEMYVGNHCLGIAAMVIFLLIILLLKGSLLHKGWFALFGLGVIFLANWFRIVGLAIMLNLGSPAFFQFNHSYTYLVMVYGIIFGLIIFFDKKLSEL